MNPGDRNYIITLTLMDGSHHVLMVRNISEVPDTIQPLHYRSVKINEWAFVPHVLWEGDAEWAQVAEYPWPC